MTTEETADGNSEESKQGEEALGAELLNLCQSITADGVIAKAEIIALTRWLRAHRDQHVPRTSSLAATVERIVEDQRVSRTERKELFLAIEKVLPLDLRKRAEASRRFVEKRRQERKQASEDLPQTEEDQGQKAEIKSQRNEPIGYFDFMAAGVHLEGRHKTVGLYANKGDSVWLVREESNPTSQHAVRIELENGSHIGYVPEEQSEEIALLMDDRMPYQAEIRDILTEGNYPIPVIHALFFSVDSDYAQRNQPLEDFDSFWETLFGE